MIDKYREIELINSEEAFFILMRKLNDIAIHLPRKESEKILYIISQLENLHYFPNDIRKRSDYDDTNSI
jgi:hypothetical protein